MVFLGGLTYLIFAIHSIAATKAAASLGTHRTVVTPAGTPLPVWAITRHVTGVAADTADDVGSVVLLLGTVVLAVTNLATVLACLVLVVTQGSVQGRKLTQLVALELVLAFGDGGSLIARSAKSAETSWGQDLPSQ